MRRITFIILCILPAVLFCQEPPSRPNIDGWEVVPWGTTLAEVQDSYGITAETTIISHDEREIVMRKGMNVSIERELWEFPSQITFVFNSDSMLYSVTAEFKKPDMPPIGKLTDRLAKTYGPSGSKPLYSISSDEEVGRTFFWVRPGGTLMLEYGWEYCILEWRETEEEVFPTPIFRAVDDKDYTELCFLADAGTKLDVTYPIFEDENGDTAEAGILDYVLLFALQNPDEPFYGQAVAFLADAGAPVNFFPVELLQRY